MTDLQFIRGARALATAHGYPSVSTFYAHLYKGRFPHIAQDGRTLIARAEDVRRYMDAKLPPPLPDPLAPPPPRPRGRPRKSEVRA